MNLWAIFATGLTTGGLTCLAMQGGLLASVIANTKERTTETHPTHDTLPVAFFLVAKLTTHILLGILLGWLGSQLVLSLTAKLVFQGLAALFMLATAANLLELHPIFRYVVLQPPKFLLRLVRTTSKNGALFTPALLGALTVFVPCGVTQSMEVLAISSGSPVIGGLIMGAFVLGTAPLFALVGVATARLSDTYKQNFLRIAAALLIFLSLQSIDGILKVINSPVSFSSITRPFTYFFSEERFSSTAQTTQTGTALGVQNVLIQVLSNGYSPKLVKVNVGVPVNLTLQTKNTYSCASSFVLKAFDIQLQLGPTDSQTVSFTPTKKGKFPFTCSMGMYSGVLEVL